jgi:hypothetical protein
MIEVEICPFDKVVTDVTGVVTDAVSVLDAGAGWTVPVAEAGICPGPMTDTAGGADPLAVADADDEACETVPVAEAGMVPTPISEIAGTAVAEVDAEETEDEDVNVWVS